MYVIATAGHVDHGKSTLVRALTGSDPDRLAEEHRRGLSIELGYAWTDLPSGRRLAFVDVPGHERFLGTMLSGIGPVPAVLLVVSADEGWRRQTGEHVAALAALDVRHGLLVVSRTDLADPKPAAEDALLRLADTPLSGLPWVGVSARTGTGLRELRAALDVLIAKLPAPPQVARTRLFVDRVFAARGAGTVVTGTLQAGAIQVGDRVEVAGMAATVRALESCREPAPRVDAVARVAVNLRGVAHEQVHRGDAVLTPDAWSMTTAIDVSVLPPAETLPRTLILHVGSAAIPVTPRLLAGASGGFARLTLARPLPLQPGDRGVLRDPGRHAVAAGVRVLDVDPPPLTQRGAARRRAVQLAAGYGADQALSRYEAVRRSDFALLGWPDPADAQVHGEWWVSADAAARWQQALLRLVSDDRSGERATGGPAAATAAALLPDPQLLASIAAACGLVVHGGRLVPAADGRPRLPPAVTTALDSLLSRLAEHPFAAPDAAELVGLGLDARARAVLADAGLLLRLPGDVLLLPDAPARAAALLRGLDAPFTLSQARQALGTTRRVAVPLLEHLDRIRVTVRVDASSRRLR
jgi:selenocysteine-specific elongation factor